MNKTQKTKQLKLHPRCYVCEALELKNADFSGYDLSHINFDHWKPKGLIGEDQSDLVANQVPIHAHPDGKTFKDEGYENAALRNCHKGKSNTFESGSEWATAVRIWRSALRTEYSDDLQPERKKTDLAQRISLRWDDTKGTVTFRGDTYPVSIQKTTNGNVTTKWKSFSTVVPVSILWKDEQVQSRPADSKRVAELAIHLRHNPLLSSLLCRVSDSRLKVFDGNHRLIAFMLARPGEDIPVTIFEGPDPKMFLEVVGKAHDDLTQQKYQYTDKALKYSALNKDELEKAESLHGNDASERLAWQGKPSKDVRLRIAGRMTDQLDREGAWRKRWKDFGLTDKSWNEFIAMYTNMGSEKEPFSSPKYLREEEYKNMCFLCRVFDEELFDNLDRTPAAKASLKTKWWKMAHKRLLTRMSQVVRDSLELPETPPNPCYTPEWNSYIQKMIRGAVKKWANSPAWRYQTTANNEPDVADHLNNHGFTENYLM